MSRIATRIVQLIQYRRTVRALRRVPAEVARELGFAPGNPRDFAARVVYGA